MITCVLKGGLGNIMFQMAALEYMSYTSGIPKYYYNLNYHINLLHSFSGWPEYKQLQYAHEYLTIFKNLKLFGEQGSFDEMIQVPFRYVELDIKDNTCYDGFFQSEKYFNNKSFIWNIFEPSDKIKTSLLKYNNILDGITCSLHVRRGDYVQRSNIHPVQNLNYYKNAIDSIGKVDRYIIFSDDIQWCKENFNFNNMFFIESERDYIELFLQSKCTHNIIANSSFSWWGAWLNQYENKKVVAPSRWFGDGFYDKIDIIPEDWITI